MHIIPPRGHGLWYTAKIGVSFLFQVFGMDLVLGKDGGFFVYEIKDYIEFRGHIECHDDLLNECKSFRGVEDFTRLDLKTAFGMALLGSKSRYRELLGDSDGDVIDIDGLF